MYLKLIFWESKGFPLMKRKICLPSTSGPDWAVICLMLSIQLLASVISNCYFTFCHVHAQFLFLLSGMSSPRAGQFTL